MPDHAKRIARDEALARTVALVNDKGGVGKTTIAVNLAGQLAGAGFSVLLVDLNRQANVARDLGYRNSDVDDHGRNLFDAITGRDSLKPAHGVRDGLDVAPGGIELDELLAWTVTQMSRRGPAVNMALGDALAPVAPNYDFVLIDSPPEATFLVDLCLYAARWILIPTRSDGAGLDGMSNVAQRFTVAQQYNPSLSLLGAVLFGTGVRSTSIHDEVRNQISEAFGGQSPLFSALIRFSEKTAQDGRRLGRLAHELEEDLAGQPAWWTELREGKRSGPRISATAASVAGDYRDLALEVLAVLRHAEEPEPAGEASEGVAQ
ncbi:ParA family protein [Pseudonocardia sp. HH130630-07]|uniref:ParA family protein n=1 Tax=Pseudonocardia sp. HH130630-07 TaxID=1690815 RepID=UPI000815120E|nr:ParA family protein [Pseudonocardia sp. HH130630-07]ANY10691.1 cobyrinic acid ac-diamide synthase [Pseudonocardia sp. HH130630-07]